MIFGINEVYIILALEGLGGLLFSVGYYVYMKSRFFVNICEKYLNTYKIKAILRVPLKSTEIKWGKFAYQIDFTNAIIGKNGKPILYYLYQKAKPIKPIEGIETKEDAKVFKVVTDGKFMQGLGERKMTRTYMYLILGLIIVIGIISIFSIYQTGVMNKEILNLTREMINATKPIDGGIIIP